MMETDLPPRRPKFSLATPRFSDKDCFSTGETYLDRLFATVHLWMQARKAIRREPHKKPEILRLYEELISELPQTKSAGKEY
ncbi:MAG: hypothetical protein ACE5OZ_07100 [Candidatus Heimdallarchaeota archaeon]